MIKKKGFRVPISRLSKWNKVKTDIGVENSLVEIMGIFFITNHKKNLWFHYWKKKFTVIFSSFYFQ